MSLANKLTILRIFLCPFFILFLSFENLTGYILSFILAICAALTDLLDGRIARSQKKITDWGKYMDPIADKIFVFSGFIYFSGVPQLHIPAYLVSLMLAREMLVLGLRSIGASKGIVISASASGKAKTVMQMLCIIVILLILIVLSATSMTTFDIMVKGGVYLWIGIVFDITPFILMLVTLVFTLSSGIGYFREHKRLIRI